MSFLDEAQKLKDKNPKIKPQEIIKQLTKRGFKLPEGKRLESKGHGQLGYKNLSARRETRAKYNAKRSDNIKSSTPTLTKNQKAETLRIKKENSAAGLNTDHVLAVKKSGPQLAEMTPRERAKLHRSYNFGDHPGNLQGLTSEDNIRKDREEDVLERRLKKMEEQNPSQNHNGEENGHENGHKNGHKNGVKNGGSKGKSSSTLKIDTGLDSPLAKRRAASTAQAIMPSWASIPGAATGLAMDAHLMATSPGWAAGLNLLLSGAGVVTDVLGPDPIFGDQVGRAIGLSQAMLHPMIYSDKSSTATLAKKTLEELIIE